MSVETEATDADGPFSGYAAPEGRPPFMFNVGLVVAPRGTRLAASVLSALTISDFLQIGRSRLTPRA
jgi:hypothetical protein